MNSKIIKKLIIALLIIAGLIGCRVIYKNNKDMYFEVIKNNDRIKQERKRLITIRALKDYKKTCRIQDEETIEEMINDLKKENE